MYLCLNYHQASLSLLLRVISKLSQIFSPAVKRLLYSHDHYTYTYTYRNIFNTIRTSGDSSLGKYTSHFIRKGSKVLLKVLLCERWVGDWTELQHIDPPPNSSGYNSISFPFSWAAQPGAWGTSLSGTWSSFQHLLSNWSEALNSNCSIGGPEGPPLLGAGFLYSILSPTDLNFLCTELYYCFTPTQFNLSTVKVIPLIPSTGCTCYLHRAFPILTARQGSICNTVNLDLNISIK